MRVFQFQAMVKLSGSSGCGESELVVFTFASLVREKCKNSLCGSFWLRDKIAAKDNLISVQVSVQKSTHG